jgi:hypothetical protein
MVGREVVRVDLVVRLGRVAGGGLVVRDEVRARHGLVLVGHRVVERVVTGGDAAAHDAVDRDDGHDQRCDDQDGDQDGHRTWHTRARHPTPTRRQTAPDRGPRAL